MNVSDVFVNALVQEGVKYIFGIPGEENLDLLESIRKSSITFITTRHEQAAGFMAATVGRLTGVPGVCLSTLGPGATNLVTAVAYAQLGAMPTVFITGQKPIKNRIQGDFQVVDTVEMMKPITKYSKQITHGELTASVVRQAFKLAMEERPGATHIELPEDIAQEKVKDVFIFKSIKPKTSLASTESISLAVRMIQEAKSPLLLIGAAANRDSLSQSLTEFVNKTNIPFFTTQMGKGVIDERHDRYLGTAALSANDYIHSGIERADLIINVGHDTIEKPPFIMKPKDGQKVIHINFSSATPGLIYAPQLEVVGDIYESINQINKNIILNKLWDFTFFDDTKMAIKKSFAKLSRSKKYPYNPYQIITELREVLGEGDLVTLDNGMYKIWFARHYPTYNPSTLLLDNSLASMGAGLPTAIAAKLINPNVRVVSVCGDGGFMMNSQEIETAVRLKINLTVLIIRDDAYGMIGWKQETMNLKPYGLKFGNPDFVKYAKAYGASGYRVEKTADLKKYLLKSFKKSGVNIIDLLVDYTDNQKVLVNELKLKKLEN